MKKVAIIILILLTTILIQTARLTSDEQPPTLQIGKRIITGDIKLMGGNETIYIAKYTSIKELKIDEQGVNMMPYASQIKILPDNLLLYEMDMLLFQIVVNPSQQIKAVEINMSYDQTIMQIIEVTEGDLFTGYDTFFVVHKIDNNKGYLTAYNLIVGEGTTMEQGTFINILMNTLNNGVAVLRLKEAGIVNETQYIEIEKYDAMVYIAYPWDAIPDRIINYKDVSITVNNYGKTGEPGWTRADMNKDGKVNYKDISMLVSRYGERY